MEYILPITIGIIQSTFFSKLGNDLYKVDGDDLQYGNFLWCDNIVDSEEKKICEGKQKIENDKTIQTMSENTKRRTKKFIFMSLSAIVLFVMIFKLKTTREVQFGVCFGSLLMLMYSLYETWSSMGEMLKLLILGGSLLILLYGAANSGSFLVTALD
jgi:hypothetical protein